MANFHHIHSAPNRIVQIEQKEWLYFSGTAYLGVQQHPQFLQILAEQLQRYGSNFGGSRRSNVRFKIIETAEQLLAKITTAPAALTFSSGTLAGQILVQYLEQLQWSFYFAPQTHPAVWNASFQSSNATFSDWTTEIIRIAEQHIPPLILLCNALDPLRCELMDFTWLWDLPQQQKYILVVDDSHGIGVTGRNGGGFYERIKVPDWVDLIVVASLGKAYGITGGVILGKKSHISALQQSAFFGGASPISPALLATFVDAQDLYQQQRAILKQRIAQFSTLPQLDTLFQYLNSYPVFYTRQAALAQHLEKQEIMISQFPYPSPTDDLITRVIISAAHTEADVDRLKNALSGTAQ
ncbi:MAG: aminotransferase class I/II-fold pyridoxal phosphate-dependent enzyme [Saprospiraceae bacterium]